GRTKPLAVGPEPGCGDRPRLLEPGLRATRTVRDRSRRAAWNRRIRLTQPRQFPPGLRRRLSQLDPLALGTVLTALAAEIPARLASSTRPRRLGYRSMHAR